MTTAPRNSDTVPIVRFAPDVVVRQVGEEAVALKLTEEVAFSLNETAARVALLIADGLGLPAIIERLAAEYGQPVETVSAEVHGLIEDFTAKGLIERSDPSGRL